MIKVQFARGYRYVDSFYLLYGTVAENLCKLHFSRPMHSSSFTSLSLEQFPFSEFSYQFTTMQLSRMHLKLHSTYIIHACYVSLRLQRKNCASSITRRKSAKEEEVSRKTMRRKRKSLLHLKNEKKCVQGEERKIELSKFFSRVSSNRAARDNGREKKRKKISTFVIYHMMGREPRIHI